MRGVFVVGLALAPLAVLASCSKTYGTGSTSESPDATTPDSGAITIPDASTADADGGCTALIDDDFTGSELDPAWVVTGNPPVIGVDEIVLLDTNQTAAASAIWHSAIVPRGSTLRIQAELRISPVTENTADGMAIAWAPAVAGDPGGMFLKTIGGAGEGLAICSSGSATGPEGALALGLLTFEDDAGGFPPRHLSLLDQTATTCATTIVTPVTLTGTIPTTLEIQGTQLSGNLLGPVTATLPRETAIAWIGFTAGSGEFSSRQSVAHVHVASCP